MPSQEKEVGPRTKTTGRMAVYIASALAILPLHGCTSTFHGVAAQRERSIQEIVQERFDRLSETEFASAASVDYVFTHGVLKPAKGLSAVIDPVVNKMQLKREGSRCSASFICVIGAQDLQKNNVGCLVEIRRMKSGLTCCNVIVLSWSDMTKSWTELLSRVEPSESP